jgi:hypothetical protein
MAFIDNLHSKRRLAAEADEETIASQHYKKYQNQGPSYYGDLDEAEDELLSYEVDAENEGPRITLHLLDIERL